jgi:hypothetical protein
MEYIQNFGGETSWDNIKMDLKETGCGNKRWTKVAQDCIHWLALVSAELKLQALLP